MRRIYKRQPSTKCRPGVAFAVLTTAFVASRVIADAIINEMPSIKLSYPIGNSLESPNNGGNGRNTKN